MREARVAVATSQVEVVLRVVLSCGRRGAPGLKAAARLFPCCNSDESQVSRLLATVPRFEAVTFSSQRQLQGRGTRGLADLEACARELLQELSLESYAPGVDLYVQGRLKSLYRCFGCSSPPLR